MNPGFPVGQLFCFTSEKNCKKIMVILNHDKKKNIRADNLHHNHILKR